MTDPDCEDCDGTGHREGCDAREPAWDLADLMCRYPCEGCCPHGHRPHGLQSAQDAATSKARRLLSKKR